MDITLLPIWRRGLQIPPEVASFFPEAHSELHFEGSQSLPETSLLSGCLPLSAWQAGPFANVCVSTNSQSVSILVCGFSWDQLCLLSPLNGRAVCKHPGIKPSGARSGPTAELPVPCVTMHPLAPRPRSTAGSAFLRSRAMAGTGSHPCPAHGALLSHQPCLAGPFGSSLAHRAAESSPE